MVSLGLVVVVVEKPFLMIRRSSESFFERLEERGGMLELFLGLYIVSVQVIDGPNIVTRF